MNNSTTNLVNTVVSSVKKLKDLVNAAAPTEQVSTQLQLIQEECDKGLDYRLAAGKAGAYDVILDTLDKYKQEHAIGVACLKTMVALMTKQPDLLTDRGIVVMIKRINRDLDFDYKKFALKWAKTCCVANEANRQNLFNAHIVDKLKELLQEVNAETLKEVLAVCRALVLDDDDRVHFGLAHERARVIASETLCYLTGLLACFQSDEKLVHDLVLTLSSLVVRAEFCKKVDDAGGLKMIHDIMKMFSSNEKIIRQCLKLIKTLAGNDECKVNIIKKNLGPVITQNIKIHKCNAATVTVGLSCIAALTLRCPDNSKALFDKGMAQILVEVMKLHPDQKAVHKNACWAIRNMVSRNRNQCETFLDLGVEELLQQDLNQFEDLEYDVKAALRDLGCQVHLKEEWTGKGGKLN